MLSKENPLWLPKGSVRAVLALGVVSAFIAGVLLNTEVTALAAITVMVMKDYFQSKDNQQTDK